MEDLYTKTLRTGLHRAHNRAGVPAVFEEHFVQMADAPVADKIERVLLIGADFAPTQQLAQALERAGAIIVRFDPASLSAMDLTAATAAIEAFASGPETSCGIVFLTGTFPEAGADASADAVEAAVEASTVTLIALGQVLDRLRSAPVRPSLIVVTRGSRRLPTDGPMPVAGLADSALIGVTRTIASECEEFVVRQVDADAAAFADPAGLAALILQPTLETEIVVRGSVGYAPRLEQMRDGTIAPLKRRLVRTEDDSNYRVTMSAPGIIDNIILREAATPEPRAGEIIVEVAAVGLNFRDIMAATSILPDELEGDDAWWRNLGFEFGGTVKVLGPGVDGLKVGDRIAGMGKGFLRRYARMPAAMVIRVPESMDLVAAATIPAAFMRHITRSSTWRGSPRARRS
jgi:hypothetical protein